MRTFHSEILQLTVLLYHRGPNQEWFHWSQQENCKWHLQRVLRSLIWSQDLVWCILIFKLASCFFSGAHQVSRFFAGLKKVTVRQCNLSNVMVISGEYKQQLLCVLTMQWWSVETGHRNRLLTYTVAQRQAGETKVGDQLFKGYHNWLSVLSISYLLSVHHFNTRQVSLSLPM